MEAKTMRIPNESQFSLSKVKLIKDGGLDVTYEVTETISDETYVNKYHVENSKEPHPDLVKCLKAMRPIMARLYNLTAFLTLLETKDFKATATQKKLAEDFAKEAKQNIEMRGVSFSGIGDNSGVVLTGIFEFSNGLKVAIKSPRLKFVTESFGFEEELESLCGTLEKEVYAFLFKNKKAHLELFGDEGEAANPE